MKYYTTKEAAELLGVTKRYITKLCASKAISGAEKKGSRWMIPESFIAKKSKRNVSTRVFNTTGICNPAEHYMVDLTQRLLEVRKLVDEGKYFTINRARQFGKTTTLHALAEYLSQDYLVISMDFQMQMSDAKFRNENSFSLAFARAFENSYRITESGRNQEYQAAFKEFTKERQEVGEQFELVELFQALSNLCAVVPKKIVLMIDEVDSATNNQVFLDFLAQLRGYYINRSRFATFQSVILAGVCDIRNLKRKMRPEEEHKDNSPWNIAADFKVDMSFSKNDIAGMLEEYEADWHTGMDIEEMSGLLYDYTSGYPFLVSRLCQLMDEQVGGEAGQKREAWTKDGFYEAVRMLLAEKNTLFESLIGKLHDYPDLNMMLRTLLFTGRSFSYSADGSVTDIASMFGFIKNKNGNVAVSNRIFETRLYNYYLSEDEMQNTEIYKASLNDKNQFIVNGHLDMRRILERFAVHFNDIYGDRGEKFLEEEGRQYFLLYLRPIINGVGNYYIEARTRGLKRTDLIVDYRGERYVVEMKIWHGEEYNRQGEEQLLGYLEDYHNRFF